MVRGVGRLSLGLSRGRIVYRQSSVEPIALPLQFTKSMSNRANDMSLHDSPILTVTIAGTG